MIPNSMVCFSDELDIVSYTYALVIVERESCGVNLSL